MPPRALPSRPMIAGALSSAALVLLLAAGCSSGTNPGTGGATIPDRPSTTTSEPATTTTDRRPATTSTTTAKVTTTTSKSTTTTGDAPTTTADPTTTTTERTTTTTDKATTTTEKKETTTTEAGTTTTVLDTTLADSKQDDMPWIALGILAAVLVLILIVAMRRRAQRAAWWKQADALVGEGRSVVDLGSAGPAGTDPQQVIAHWGTIEQRAQAFAVQIQALAAGGVPDDVVRGTLGGLTQATTDYLGALQTARTLRIGPPAPTPEQLQFADAEAAQRLAIVRATLDQLDQQVLPHRKTA